MSLINPSNLYLKIERLSSAIFLVSSSIVESVELRTKIRGLVIDLMSICASIKDSRDAVRLNLLYKMESVLTLMASLFNVASISGLVSSMNASILEQEFHSAMNDLSEWRKSCIQKSLISKSIFAIDKPENIRENTELENRPILGIDTDQRLLSSRGISIQPKINRINRREYREKAIIDLIKMRQKVSIKDISKSIKGCSEKTIQRKLVSLIKAGIIKKDGERRWSKYTMF